MQDFFVAAAVFHAVNQVIVIGPQKAHATLVEALAEICLVITMQFACQMEPDFINESRQVHPAAHRFARTARINDVAHVMNC